jgi:hypothetical protein
MLNIAHLIFGKLNKLIYNVTDLKLNNPIEGQE